MGSCVGGDMLSSSLAPAQSSADFVEACEIVEPTACKTASVIVIHGLGHDGKGLKEVVMDYGRYQEDSDLASIKWLFPTAPVRAITVNHGERLNGWFDIAQFDDLQEPTVDPTGIQESIDRIQRLISMEVNSGVPRHRIAVMGISQGGHVALKLALQTEPPLTACVALSTWLEPTQSLAHEDISSKGTKFFVGHGKQDGLIPVEQATFVKENLGRSGFKEVEVKEYVDLEHWMSPDELKDVATFLKSVLQ